MKNKIFLGGTCNDSTWRDELIEGLKVDFFNPVVEDWTPEYQEIERQEKSLACNIHFYCITSQMIGVFSIAEVIDSVHTKGKLTILHIKPEGFTKSQLKSLEAVANMVRDHGGIAYLYQELHRSIFLLNQL